MKMKMKMKMKSTNFKCVVTPQVVLYVQGP